MITTEEAIRRAEQWRKDGACGPAAVVAIALLDELERAYAAFQDNAIAMSWREFFVNDKASAEPVDFMQPWSLLERAGSWVLADRLSQAKLERVRPAPATLAQAQRKVNDNTLAAQRNLLLREDGYPNARLRPGTKSE